MIWEKGTRLGAKFTFSRSEPVKGRPNVDCCPDRSNDHSPKWGRIVYVLFCLLPPTLQNFLFDLLRAYSYAIHTGDFVS